MKYLKKFEAINYINIDGFDDKLDYLKDSFADIGDEFEIIFDKNPHRDNYKNLYLLSIRNHTSRNGIYMSKLIPMLIQPINFLLEEGFTFSEIITFPSIGGEISTSISNKDNFENQLNKLFIKNQKDPKLNSVYIKFLINF